MNDTKKDITVKSMKEALSLIDKAYDNLKNGEVARVRKYS